MNEPSLPSRRKKDLRFYDHVSWRILLGKCKKPSIKSWPMACFRCNMTENFIFSLKYCQRKVDPNTSRKSHVFGTIRHRQFHLYVQLSYTKISYLCKNTHLWNDAASLHFPLKESSENMIYPWNGNIRKETKIWSFLHFSQIFLRWKFFFSCSVNNLQILAIKNAKSLGCYIYINLFSNLY